jgi:hypothetical protein
MWLLVMGEEVSFCATVMASRDLAAPGCRRGVMGAADRLLFRATDWQSDCLNEWMLRGGAAGSERELLLVSCA